MEPSLHFVFIEEASPFPKLNKCYRCKNLISRFGLPCEGEDVSGTYCPDFHSISRDEVDVRIRWFDFPANAFKQVGKHYEWEAKFIAECDA